MCMLVTCSCGFIFNRPGHPRTHPSSPTRRSPDPLGGLATRRRTRRDPEQPPAGRADGGPRASGTTPEVRCGHNGLVMIHGVVGGYVARCLACQMMGPVWDDPEAARRALLELGMTYRV